MANGCENLSTFKGNIQGEDEMKKILLFGFLLAVLPLWGQEIPTPAATVYLNTEALTPTTPLPALITKWNVATVPWDTWFKNNAMVTDKSTYVHFFWNAQDVKMNFEVKSKKQRLGEAALQLVSRLFPADSKADQVKVDIVYVLQRDSYGKPMWETLQRVAHFEFLRSKVLSPDRNRVFLNEGELKKVFNTFEFY